MWGMYIYMYIALLPFFTIGCVSNGEFNHMRAKGYTRPLSVLQVRAVIRAKYARKSQRTMLAMLTPQRKYKTCL